MTKSKNDSGVGETENDQGAKVVPWVGELLSQVRAGLRQNCQAIIGPLEEIVSRIWDEHYYRAFGELKRRLTSAHVLKFPEFKKPFEMHTDTSDFAIGGVLMQEGRPVAFESKKLSDVERRWLTHEKEMWAVVHCLKLWQHYLGLEYTKVYTDNVSMRYLETQPKITPKQWRWADVLACFQCGFDP